MSDTVEEHRAKLRAAAAEAMARGQAAMVAGDMPGAQRWLDRARRITGGNDAIELLLATARLHSGNLQAQADFAGLAARHDLREAWLGLATARHRAGDAAGAATALSEALAGHIGALPPALHPLADAIAKAAGAAGWCCLGEDRTVHMVRIAEGALLGSPFQLARMTRLEAFVDEAAGGLAGYAWHPNDPATLPGLRVIAADGASLPIILGEPGSGVHGERQQRDRPLSQARAFAVAAGLLPGLGPFRVVDAGERDIPGSPLDPGAVARYAAAVTRAWSGHAPPDDAWRQAPVPADTAGAHRPSAAPAPPPRATVVVPVYRGLEATLACLDSLFASTPPDARLIVVDDAGPDPALAAALDSLAQSGRITLICHPRNRGFPAAANTGLRAAGDDDVVLLNADTLVPPNWLERLRQVAHGAADIGTVTPFSNDATLLSYPRQEGGNAVPDRAAVTRLDRLADRANGGRSIDIPTAVGFCMYIRRDCLEQVGPLREDVFAQGYGEENDFCLRARTLGWRHVAAPGVFVGHVGSVSFGAARSPLLTRNLAILNRLHPGYDALIAADHAGPALAAARRRIDLAALASSRRGRRSSPTSVVLITHDLGGGVQRQVDVRCAAIRAAGETPIVIRPILARPLLQGTGECRVDLGPDQPNLIYQVGAEFAELTRLLAASRPRLVEVHHMLGHDHGLMALAGRLGVPYEVYIHDYAWFCERVTLVGFERRYCGEPDIAGCEACIADAGRNIDEDIPVAALVARSAADLAAAARVVAPSDDVATRIARHFPGIRAAVEPWDDSRPAAAIRPPPATRDGPRVVGILGAIGIEKGYDMLLACARDAAARALPLRFVVLGHTTDDARLLQTGAVFITGEYREDELPRLIRAERIDLAFLPSIWPETWCFTLSEAWRAALHVVAFDIGTPAERIRRHGGGTLIPLACRAGQVNGVLLQ